MGVANFLQSVVKLHQRVRDIEYFSSIVRLSRKWFLQQSGKPLTFRYEVYQPGGNLISSYKANPDAGQLDHFQAVDTNGHVDQDVKLLNTGYYYDIKLSRGDADLYWFSIFLKRNDDLDEELVIGVEYDVHSANRHVIVLFFEPQGGGDIAGYKSPIQTSGFRLVFSETELGNSDFHQPGRLVYVGGRYDINNISRYYIFLRVYAFPKSWLDYVFS